MIPIKPAHAEYAQAMQDIYVAHESSLKYYQEITAAWHDSKATGTAQEIEKLEKESARAYARWLALSKMCEQKKD